MQWQDRINALDNLDGIDKLVEIMAMLRDPENGCPWDLKQTFKSIVPYTIEEAYEVADAIEKQDFNEVKKELGDLLFQVVFYGQLGTEQQMFGISQIADSMSDKLISRHPHVFANTSFASDDEINANWEKTKSEERTATDPKNVSALDDIPIALPALSRAYKIQKRASSVGFDWPDVNGAIDKVFEEIDEVQHEIKQGKVDKDKLADELGDLYFALTNVTRHLGFKPEDVVRLANNKFDRRFRDVERQVTAANKNMTNMTLEELDALWELAKANTAK
ncbi:nucleoside triphosphate pyrophosphohydrolase [Psychrosphaera sp. 1_MG-2023]|uniref:nucleoside triphosphate pyrophosphohydrolase n=1 Tax=Psychrosphaera sp. 1_MG-2023 TaxID=3062643 RepID=UPI0026E2676F|nr:nucleoside triphosphate pyrophosphohydrolase [Psychrosphaera sp. 1_MG-2023]MDO6719219.1 nucleoside triphosphate pyrophosphohydrolase [Psychrosphaera sp. 1_MG-2023]